MSKTHWKKLINPDYLGAYSLDDGNGKYISITPTIASVRTEDVTGPDGKSKELVARFRDAGVKPMILNSTNCKTLEKLFKTPYPEDWGGRKIEIGVESVKAFGDVVDALRIKKRLPAEQNNQSVPVCLDCKNEITAAGEMNVSQVVAFARKRFGADLCADCMKKRDAIKKAEQEAAAEAAPDNAEGSATE
jgi:hypothetical protein